jgi:hypothetical protein
LVRRGVALVDIAIEQTLSFSKGNSFVPNTVLPVHGCLIILKTYSIGSPFGILEHYGRGSNRENHYGLTEEWTVGCRYAEKIAPIFENLDMMCVREREGGIEAGIQVMEANRE